jgi:heme/copper-type cytochrome/quinol oxidase subunit 2
MLLRVVVDSDQDFAAWVSAQQQPAAEDEQVAWAGVSSRRPPASAVTR